MPNIIENLRIVLARIAQAERSAGRTPGAVQLLAVSKGHQAADIRAAFAAGQRRFGESYLQEAMDKMAALTDLALEWHFIGPVQSNKTKNIAEHFDWIHSIDRDKVALRLNQHRPAHLPPLAACIQVNISGEASKSGVEPGHLHDLAKLVNAQPRLQLRGLMAIPAAGDGLDGRQRAFRHLRQLAERLGRQGVALDTLSMGMSDDLEAAVAEGATLVRVGTAIFGARDRKG